MYFSWDEGELIGLTNVKFRQNPSPEHQYTKECIKTCNTHQNIVLQNRIRHYLENAKDCVVIEKHECCLNSDLFVPIIL